MRLIISGSSGLLGSHLAADQRRQGHTVLALVRRKTQQPDEITWSPESDIPVAALADSDAVIHLSGENINARWTNNKKSKLRASRIDVTRRLCEQLATLAQPPTILICASAIGIYGDRGDETLDEMSAPGHGFLAELCRDWEQACAPAVERGIRVVHLRLGVVLSKKGGMLKSLLPAFQLGLGGKIGNGRQWQSWISLTDMCRAVDFILHHSLSGPVNVTAPQPIQNADMVKWIGRLLARPVWFHQPGWVLKLLLGQMAEEVLLASCRAIPARLQREGFKFLHPEFSTALHAEWNS